MGKKYDVSEMIGTRKIMNNGKEAVIVTWRKAKSIDVFFPESGITRKEMSYGDFLRGGIVETVRAKASDHIGERVYQNKDKMWAVVVECEDTHNMTIEFENKRRRQNVSYSNFKRGTVSQYTPEERLEIDRRERVGQKIDTKYGECEIIEYFCTENITVRFTNTGSIVVNRRYGDFIKKKIKDPTVSKDPEKQAERLHMRKCMNCGGWCEVIVYRSTADITVRFDDGQVVEHRQWLSFVHGTINPPDIAPVRDGKSRIGEIRQNRCGDPMRLIAYRSATDVDVLFIDSGTIITNTSYRNFDEGVIANPECASRRRMSLQEFSIQYYLRNLGFRKLARGEWKDLGFGLKEIDFYSETTNVGIEYDGGIHDIGDMVEQDIDKNEKCKQLGVKLYRLRDPRLPLLEDGNSTNYVLLRDKKIMAGLIDCKVELEEILKNNGIEFDGNYINFQRDKEMILSEYKECVADFYRQNRVGETVYSKPAKMNMTIVNYYGYHNVEVEFDDEYKTRRSGVNYSSFKNGSVSHPNNMRKTKSKGAV